jgi:hypothetical protein
MNAIDQSTNPNLVLYSHLRDLHWTKQFSQEDMILLISKIEDWIYCHNQEELNKNNDINYDTINTLQTLADNYLIHY